MVEVLIVLETKSNGITNEWSPLTESSLNFLNKISNICL
jgi:hypothetical protein